jgi:hypothetical protein
VRGVVVFFDAIASDTYLTILDVCLVLENCSHTLRLVRDFSHFFRAHMRNIAIIALLCCLALVGASSHGNNCVFRWMCFLRITREVCL